MASRRAVSEESPLDNEGHGGSPGAGSRTSQDVGPERVRDAWGEIYRDHPAIAHASLYERIGRVSHRDFIRIVSRVLRTSVSQLILEAGCGKGVDGFYLASIGHSVVSLDCHLYPLNAIRTAAAAARRRGSTPDIRPVAGDIFDPPFRANSFDLVFNSGVVEHFSSRATRVRMLAALAGVVKQGGCLAVAIPNKTHPLARYWTALISRSSDFDSYGIPECAITPAEIKEEMEEAGLREVVVEGLDVYDTLSHYPEWLPLRLVSYAARMLLPMPSTSARRRFGVRLLALGTKE